jgi:hypothetical protein
MSNDKHFVVSPKVQGFLLEQKKTVPKCTEKSRHDGYSFAYDAFFFFRAAGEEISPPERKEGLEKKQKKHGTVPETASGGQVANTKAFEITTLKELGKMTL